jgi:hypothetical protein
MRLCSRPLVFAASLALFGILAWRFFDHSVDDAFISYRYARNLVEGHGLVFNPGERVEGYTNFLWVMLVAPFVALGIDPDLAAKALGLAAGAGLLGGLARFGPRPQAAPGVVWIAPLAAASSPALAVWATGGLETALFAALLLWSAGLAIEALERKRISAASALLAALAALTRPEGVGVALLLGAMLGLLGRGHVPLRRDLTRWWVVFLLVYLPYFAWRSSYYGDLLPNTFYAKVGSEPAQLLRGLRYVHAFLRESGYWLLLPLVGLAWVGRGPARCVYAGLAGGLTLYVVGVGGDGLPMHRFLVPILPFLFLLIALGCAGVLTRIGTGRGARIGVALLVLALGVRAAVPAFRGASARYVAQDRREVAAWTEIGRYFAANAPSDASIAVVPAGAVPYFSKLVAIDMLGLNDRTIARRRISGLGAGQAGHEKHDVGYVLGRRPTYVLIGAYGLSSRPLPAGRLVRPWYAAEIAMLESPEFLAAYRLERARAESGYFAYFVRREPGT